MHEEKNAKIRNRITVARAILLGLSEADAEGTIAADQRTIQMWMQRYRETGHRRPLRRPTQRLQVEGGAGAHGKLRAAGVCREYAEPPKAARARAEETKRGVRHEKRQEDPLIRWVLAQNVRDRAVRRRWRGGGKRAAGGREEGDSSGRNGGVSGYRWRASPYPPVRAGGP